MTETKEPAKPNGAKSKAVAGPRAHEKLIDGIRLRAEVDKADAFDMAAAALDGIAEANDWDAIVEANEAGGENIEDFFGTPLNVTEVAFPKSDEKYKSGVGAFVVMTCFTDDGAPHTFKSGGPNVVGAMFRAQQLGLIREEKPLRMKITGTATPNGTLHRVGKA